MLGSPRIVAIDDDASHLAGLANGLSRGGFGCLQIHFTGDLTGITACPDVRIIFADLHLGTGTFSDPSADFATITGILEDTIKPSGPYFIVLWTQHPSYAPTLNRHLDERLAPGVTKPFDVCSLPKADHIDGEGEITNHEKLMQSIKEMVLEFPQVGALVEWESQVLAAAGRTVASILSLTSNVADKERSREVDRILGRLAVGAAGQDHVDQDRFRAVNEALLPILADRIAKMGSKGTTEELWRAAFAIPGNGSALSIKDAAGLNRLIHIADAEEVGASERGVVIPLPESDHCAFRDHFRITERDAATNLFRCGGFDPSRKRFRWVLVQCQAACDYALGRPGSVPFYLGLDFPADNRSAGKLRQSTWASPVFDLGEGTRCLRVNAGCPLALPSSMLKDMAPLYRLREQMLNELIYHVHTHGARPGIISFGKR